MKRQRPIKKKRPEPSLPIEPSKLPEDQVELTESEQDELNFIYGQLNSKQIMAARYEASGIRDRSLIASQLSVGPQAITDWRKDPNYQKLVRIKVGFIETMGIEFRLDCVRQITAPLYAELMKRMQDPEVLKNLSVKEIVDVLTKMGKEQREDQVFAKDTSSDNELEQLRQARNFMLAAQKQAIENISANPNIIEMPRQGIVNG